VRPTGPLSARRWIEAAECDSSFHTSRLSSDSNLAGPNRSAAHLQLEWAGAP